MLAPSPSTAAPLLPASPALEQLIGEVTAAAASAVLEALREFQRSGRRNGMPAGEIIAQLYELWHGVLGSGLDFGETARTYGKRALRERCGEDLSDAELDEIVSWPLEILARAINMEMN
jgi:hypothetical protein